MTTNTNLFAHRFNATQAHDPIDIQDACNAMAARAQGVLMLLFSQFESENRMNNEIIMSSINSVHHEIEDMKAIVKAHFAATKG